MKSDDVFWRADKPDGIDLFVVDNGEKLRPFSYWRKQGWRYGE